VPIREETNAGKEIRATMRATVLRPLRGNFLKGGGGPEGNYTIAIRSIEGPKKGELSAKGGGLRKDGKELTA